MLSNLIYYSLAVVVAISSNGLMCEAQDNSSSCGWNCRVADSPWVEEQWFWMSEDDPFMPVPSVTLEKKILTIVNITSNTTSTVTEYPANYTAHPTNDEGTRIATLTYSSGGTLVSSVVAYPHGFVAFPSEYVWTGSMQINESAACITAPSPGGSTVTLPPPNLDPTPFWNASDPRGTGYQLLTAAADINWLFIAYSENLTDQPAATACAFNYGGPNWGGFTQTGWYTVQDTTSVK